MELFLISAIIVAIAVFIMSFNIIFKKNGKFPESEIGHNKELRKKGLMCAKSEEKTLWRRAGSGGGCSSCSCGANEN